jgi:hypothetical protein
VNETRTTTGGFTMATKNVTPLHPVRDPDQFAEILQSVLRLTAQCAVCASAAWAISEESGGKRQAEAIAGMPFMLDSMREQLGQLADEIERAREAMSAAPLGGPPPVTPAIGFEDLSRVF